MDHQLIRLDGEQLEAIAKIESDGSIEVDADAIARMLARSLGLVGIRVAVSSADYLQRDDGVPEPATRTTSGVWWHSKGTDTSLIGGFVIDGRAMTVTTEGEGESPVAESIEIVDRATRAIASEHDDAEIVEPGLFRVVGQADEKRFRVVVTRDHRVRRPRDVLSLQEYALFSEGRLGLAILQLIGGGKALLFKHGF